MKIDVTDKIIHNRQVCVQESERETETTLAAVVENISITRIIIYRRDADHEFYTGILFYYLGMMFKRIYLS